MTSNGVKQLSDIAGVRFHSARLPFDSKLVEARERLGEIEAKEPLSMYLHFCLVGRRIPSMSRRWMPGQQ
jgi:hypothetical protein